MEPRRQCTIFFCGSFVPPSHGTRQQVQKANATIREDITQRIVSFGGCISTAKSITSDVTHVLVGAYGGGLSAHRQRQLDTVRATGATVLVIEADELDEWIRGQQHEESPPALKRARTVTYRTADDDDEDMATAQHHTITSKEASENDLWVARYAPTTPGDLVGHRRVLVQVDAWLQRWVKGDKALLLCGPAGIGKTTMAHTMARKHGYVVREFNASDVRNKASISSVVAQAAQGHGMSTSGSVCRQCIVMDEVDGLSSGDTGGETALVNVITASHVPIICICNDKYASALRSVKNHCHVLDVYKPTPRECAARLKDIAASEGVRVDAQELLALATAAGGDMRQAITSLQLRAVCGSQGGMPGTVDKSVSPYEAARQLTAYKAPYHHREAAYWSNSELMPMFLHENYIGPRASLDAVAQAADLIALGDQIDAKAFGSLFSVANVHAAVSSIIPAALVSGRTAPTITFPRILGEESKRRAAIKALATSTPSQDNDSTRGDYTHSTRGDYTHSTRGDYTHSTRGDYSDLALAVKLDPEATALKKLMTLRAKKKSPCK